MLLGSPSFSNFLDQLSSSQIQPQPSPRVEQQHQQQQQQQHQQHQQHQQQRQHQQHQHQQHQQQELGRRVPKDANPYNAQQQIQRQQIGMAMVPEPSVDFSVLNLSTDPFFQPQVYTVLETPVPIIDTALLSGKTSNFVEPFVSDDEKLDMPVIERPAVGVQPKAIAPVVVDEALESDPLFALYHDTPAAAAAEPRELNTDAMSNVDIFGGIEPEKAFARLELADASEAEAREFADSLVLARVQRVAANLEAISARLDLLCLDS